MKLEGRRVLVTGASSGIGLQLARALASRGAALAIASRNLERLSQVAAELKAAFPDAPKPVPLSCDISDGADACRLIDASIETLGNVDVLVNNAGICVYGETERTPVEDFQRLLDVNFLGPVNAMLEVLPFMKRQGHGLIVNVASVAAIHGVPYLGAYCASKAALVSLSQALRAELAGTGVRVMLAYPDYTDSQIFENEKKVGGARRPPGPYARTDRVAERIVRAMESGGRDVILSTRGRLMAALDGVLPAVLERGMRKVAEELREEE